MLLMWHSEVVYFTSLFMVVIGHQLLFQGTFVSKNVILRQRLGHSVRGTNRESSLAIAYYGLFIIATLVLSCFRSPIGSVSFVSGTVAIMGSSVLLAGSLALSSMALVALRDSWRVGIIKNEKTDLIESGVYSVSRNPYFVAYVLTFVAYTFLLQNWLLALLTIGAILLTHRMILSEEEYLLSVHGDRYREYRRRVPRYVQVRDGR